MTEQIEQINYEIELLNHLQPLKKEILDNVLAEQDFRIYLNSTDANEKALNSFCDL